MLYHPHDPHPLTDLGVKVTDIFCLMKHLYHISQSTESIHISNRVCVHSKTTDPIGCMPWGGAGGQNIEHPLTLVSKFSNFCWSDAF